MEREHQTEGALVKRRFHLTRKLAMAVATVVVISGMATATVFIYPINFTFSATQTGVSGPVCGFIATSGVVTTGLFADNNYLSGISSLTSTPQATLSVTLENVKTGGSAGTGFEYLVDEAALECSSLPSSPGGTALTVFVCGNGQTINAAGTGCSGSATAITGADWVVSEITAAVPAYSNNPTIASPSQECESSPAPLYSSITANSANTWNTKEDHIYNDVSPGWLVTGSGSSGGCIASASGPSFSNIAANTVYAWVSFAIVDESGSGLSNVLSPTFSIGYYATAT